MSDLRPNIEHQIVDEKYVLSVSCQEISRCVRRAIVKRGCALVGCSGAPSLHPLYAQLGQDKSVDWDKVFFFPCDEEMIFFSPANGNPPQRGPTQSALLGCFERPSQRNMLFPDHDVSSPRAWCDSLRALLENFPQRPDCIIVSVDPMSGACGGLMHPLPARAFDQEALALWTTRGREEIMVRGQKIMQQGGIYDEDHGDDIDHHHHHHQILTPPSLSSRKDEGEKKSKKKNPPTTTTTTMTMTPTTRCGVDWDISNVYSYHHHHDAHHHHHHQQRYTLSCTLPVLWRARKLFFILPSSHHAGEWHRQLKQQLDEEDEHEHEVEDKKKKKKEVLPFAEAIRRYPVLSVVAHAKVTAISCPMSTPRPE